MTETSDRIDALFREWWNRLTEPDREFVIESIANDTADTRFAMLLIDYNCPICQPMLSWEGQQPTYHSKPNSLVADWVRRKHMRSGKAW